MSYLCYEIVEDSTKISYSIYESEMINVMLLLFDYFLKNKLNKDFEICKRQDILEELDSMSYAKMNIILTDKRFQTITKRVFILVLNILKNNIDFFENQEKKYVQKKTDDRTPSFLVKLFQNEHSEYILKENLMPTPVPVTRTKTRFINLYKRELEWVWVFFPYIENALNTFLKNDIDNFFSFRRKVDFMKEF